MAGTSITNEQIIDQYLLMLTVSRGRSLQTIEAYAHDLSSLSYALPNLITVTSQDLDAYFSGLRAEGKRPATVARAMSATRGLFRYLVDESLLSIDPSSLLPVATRGKGLPKALPESAINQLIASIEPDDPLGVRDSLIVEFLYGTGCRVSEMINTRIDDVDFDEDVIRVTGKGSKQRLVPVGRLLRAALRLYLDGGARNSLLRSSRDTHLFLNSRGQQLGRHGVNEILRRRALKAGLHAKGIHAHAFRHSCATHMIAHGADIRVVQELLGHASIATTQRYTGVALATLRDSYARAHPRASDTP